MNTTNLKLYNFIKEEFKLSDNRAQEFTSLLERAIVEDIQHNSSEYHSVVKEDFYKLELKLEQSKTELIKWMLGIFITLIIAIIGLYFKH